MSYLNLKWSMADMDRLFEMMRSGRSLSYIARQFNTTESEIRRVIERNADYLPWHEETA